MKKFGLYSVLLLLVLGLMGLLFYAYKSQSKTLNQRISLKQRDKIPYGFYAARQLTQKLFPSARFYTENAAPGEWKKVSRYQSRQAVFLIGDLKADENELQELEQFAKAGNYVFIIAKQFSYEANHFFGFAAEDIATDDNFYSLDTDSLAIRLSAPRFADTKTYVYPGRRYSNYFDVVDSSQNLVLGRTASGHPNFIQKKAGAGFFFLHTAPLAFSNYFILHKNNFHYFEQALSVLPGDVETIVWSEYFLTKRDKEEKEPNMLAVLFTYPSFRWALWTAIFTILLYMVIEMRRKQRVIPAYERPKNDSLDFVQTIGHLYYDQNNHADLAQKMSLYFLEHVRNRYKIETVELDERFLKLLQQKSLYSPSDLKRIIDFILFVREHPISENQLTSFYSDLEKFYQST